MFAFYLWRFAFKLKKQTKTGANLTQANNPNSNGKKSPWHAVDETSKMQISRSTLQKDPCSTIYIMQIKIFVLPVDNFSQLTHI